MMGQRLRQRPVFSEKTQRTKYFASILLFDFGLAWNQHILTLTPVITHVSDHMNDQNNIKNKKKIVKLCIF